MPSRLHVFMSSYPLVFMFSRLYASSRPNVFTSPHIFISSCLHVLIFSSPSFLYFFSSPPTPLSPLFSSHILLLFTSSRLHVLTSSRLHVFTSSRLHVFTSSRVFTS